MNNVSIYIYSIVKFYLKFSCFQQKVKHLLDYLAKYFSNLRVMKWIRYNYSKKL